MEAGDLIPLERTRVPFEIYEAANEGTDVLERIDKEALRGLLDVLADSAGASKRELGRALRGLDEAGGVLADKGGRISTLLRNAERVTGVLASSDEDLGNILVRAAEVMGTLAERRATISSLLEATNDLAGNLALLLRTVRGDLALATRDLNGILLLVEGDLSTIEAALDELGLAQKMFAQPLSFGRFIEGHICAITTEDTCRPSGSPEIPGIPVKGQQPSPSPAPQEVRR
jgi:phospholipid/cholesterol/gamma-HCH transport system substrate-binding protein